MSAYEVFNKAEAAGVHLYVGGGKLCCEGEDSALDALEPVFKAHKAELLALLSQKVEEAGLPPPPKASRLGRQGSRSAIPLPTQAQQKATLDCFAKDAIDCSATIRFSG